MVTLNLDVDSATWAAAEGVMKADGQTVADFLRAWVVSLAEEAHEEPNALTRAAMAEVAEGRGRQAATVADFMTQLRAGLDEED